MENPLIRSLVQRSLILTAIVVPVMYYSCTSSTSPVVTTPPSQYTAVMLTSNTAGAAHTDPTLLNAWGIAYDNLTSSLVVSSGHGFVVTLYDTLGAARGFSVKVPSPDSVAGGTPTSVIGNAYASDFLIPGIGASSYIIAGEEGTINAWGAFLQSNPAKMVVDRSASAVFKGMAVLNHKLYVANFKENLVNTFDSQFNAGTAFTDGAAPAGYAPFNIVAIDGKLFVSFARRKAPDSEGGVDDSDGAGIGYIDTYDDNGNRLSQFASGGTLNSPWGIIQAPSNFGSYSNDILVGNFGDGTISVFDTTGKFQGQLKDKNGAVISVPGLWGLVAPPTTVASGKIFYAAGPNDEADGAIGYIQVVK